MRTRGERRHLTKCYQSRQERLYNLYNRDVWWSGYEDEVTDQRRGTWRTRSWRTCGQPGCECCCSARRSGWTPLLEKLTLPERRALDSFYAGLDEAGY